MNYSIYDKQQLEGLLLKNECTYRGYIDCYLTQKNSKHRENFLNVLGSLSIEYYLITKRLKGKQFLEELFKLSASFKNELENHRSHSPLNTNQEETP